MATNLQPAENAEVIAAGEVAAPLQNAADTMLALRQQLAELAQKESAIREKMASIEQAVLAYMHKHGLTGARVDGATLYLDVQRTPFVVDWQAFYAHVRETGDFAMLQKRLSASVVREYLTDHGVPPPGVDVMAVKKLHVRNHR